MVSYSALVTGSHSALPFLEGLRWTKGNISVGEMSLCHSDRFPPSEIRLPTPHCRWGAAVPVSQGCCLRRLSGPCAGCVREHPYALQRALLQTQMVQALFQVTAFPGGMIGSSALAGHTCAAAVVQKG